MRRQVAFKVLGSVAERHLMFLQQGMNLKTRIELQDTTDLALIQRARAIGLNGNGFK